MASKAAKSAFGGGHTAGIYADMTVDGPEIGTLVVIVDRAKNLPNRKTMGKQDPYCAARLGKEAKKTDTDKRGGQTPKWDQELRFTVHESPDYYQLKVSVFNDDKKTELIGETRIGLEDIIIPGGGQNDTWHHLHCKGRFAGEIRIELTYYDTRPKEDKPPERSAESIVEGHQDPGRESVGGPRGPKPLKRRPLPANPVGTPRPGMPEHAHSSPLPQPTIHQPIPSHPEGRGHREPWMESAPLPGNRHQHSHHSNSTGSPIGHDAYDRQWMNGSGSTPQDYNDQFGEGIQVHNAAMHMPAAHYPESHAEQYTEQYAPMQPQYDFQSNSGFRDANQDAYDVNTRHASLPPLATHDRCHSSAERTTAMAHDVYSQMPPTMPHGNSMPDVRDPSQPRFLPQHPQRHSLPGGRGHSEQSPIQQHTPNGFFDPHQDQQQSMVDYDLPPPPPAHRTNSGTNPSPLGNGRTHSESCAPIPGTAPLNIRKERGSFSNSPLSQVQTNPSYTNIPPSSSPSHVYPYAQSSTESATRHVHAVSAGRETYHRRSLSPVRNGNPLPLSLVPGYEPQTTSNEPESTVYNDSTSRSHANNVVATQQYSPSPTRSSQPRSHHAATIQMQSPLQALERGPDRRPHRASAPTVQPRDVSPDPRIPPRKSVSPQPQSNSNDRRGSGIPFGPDSYDAFNPFISSESAGVSPGARYETPDQAREAAVQHEREKKLGDGPIIGSDGREIDPSDHLPTDTWAPEPESKAPKKTAQVNFRFRNSPQGAQPMPQSGRRPLHDGSARPASISTPIYNSNANNAADNISPTTAARARLQKKTRVSPAQPNSSPIVPTVNTALQNPVLRTTASDYPLREHENYGYGSSPTYNRHSPSGIPPPIPGKVPIAMGQEDWRDPLSEELSRIDIGVGGGRARRTRYGG
ncbi:MAG: hypothetical protein L6R38_006558 [Xanthoria sp. 2 TBL-2021]|nr:MAG: hypothetical protein L6R38_006558 [Xanthoria sp. 2 TBL-2021]